MSETNQENKFTFGPGDIRKLSILGILIASIMCYESISGSFYWILASLVFLYSIDVFYTLTVSQRNSTDLKSFIFQTAVPLFALGITGIVAVVGKTDASVIVTMFGISLAYTTYVVGSPIRSPAESETANESNIPE